MTTIPLDPPADVIKLNVSFKPPVAEQKFLVQAPLNCSHYNGPFLVDEKLAEVTCGRCNAKLNPMWVLTKLMHSESRWHENMARYQGEMKRLSERKKTKCQHCKQMTRISQA
jgi:hypothetical protein